MGILEMDFERILGVPFFLSSSYSIMLCYRSLAAKTKVALMVEVVNAKCIVPTVE